MIFNFGDVITRAWQIIWKHKILWVFGILASCGRSGGGFDSNFSSRGGGNGSDQPPEIPPIILDWLQIIEPNLITIAVIVLAVVCILWSVSIFLGAIGKVGLIRGTAQAEGGAESLVFGELFSGGVPYFWRMFGLSLILSIPAFIAAIAIFVVVFGGLMIASRGNYTALVGLVGMIPIMFACLCLLAPVMFVLGMIFHQAENAVVLEEMNVLPAITRGWEVLTANLATIILMAIILGVIGFMAGFIIIIPILFTAFSAMLAFILSEGFKSPLILIGVYTCILIPVALILQGIITAYTESAWTLTYMRLTKHQDAAPVIVEANAS